MILEVMSILEVLRALRVLRVLRDKARLENIWAVGMADLSHWRASCDSSRLYTNSKQIAVMIHAHKYLASRPSGWCGNSVITDIECLGGPGERS